MGRASPRPDSSGLGIWRWRWTTWIRRKMGELVAEAATRCTVSWERIAETVRKTAEMRRWRLWLLLSCCRRTVCHGRADHPARPVALTPEAAAMMWARWSWAALKRRSRARTAGGLIGGAGVSQTRLSAAAPCCQTFDPPYASRLCLSRRWSLRRCCQTPARAARRAAQRPPTTVPPCVCEHAGIDATLSAGDMHAREDRKWGSP